MRRSRRLIIVALTAVVGLIVGSAIAAYLLVDSSAEEPRQQRLGHAIPLGTDFCPLEARASAGYLIRMPTTSVPVGFEESVKAPFLAEAAPALAALGFDRLFVAKTDDAAALPRELETVEPLYQRAADPDLHTCHYKVDNKPEPLALRIRAEEYLVRTGITTTEKLADPSSVWMISDTGLPGDTLAMYVLLQEPAPSDKRDVVMTVFQGRDGAVVGAAKVNMYAAFE